MRKVYPVIGAAKYFAGTDAQGKAFVWMDDGSQIVKVDLCKNLEAAHNEAARWQAKVNAAVMNAAKAQP